MDNTGEQFIPGISSRRLADEHAARYEFAASFVKDASVLDIACGTGYGSAFLARQAARVVGVDVSSDSIAYAQTHYASPNLTFMQADATDGNLFQPAMFDVACSFETIEHLDKEQRTKFLMNLKKWIKPSGGVLLMSTPNKSVTSPYTAKPLNPHHLIEFTLISFSKEITPYFVIEDTYGQRIIPRVLVNTLVRKSTRVLEKVFRRDFHLYDLANGPSVLHFNSATHEPRIQIIKCSQQPTGDASGVTPQSS